MLFTEPAFLFVFLPALLFIYFVAPTRLRNGILLFFSLGFYAYGEKLFVGLMILSIAFNYLVGLSIDRLNRPINRKLSLIGGVVGNLTLLVSFKYSNFFVDNLNLIFVTLELQTIKIAPVHLPIGISFFTFQAMSYIIDTYRNETKAQKDPIQLALYISLFPQLIAGPIVRYRDLARQLIQRSVSAHGFAHGVQRFLIGLGKKMIVANAVAYPADQIFNLPLAEVGPSLAWLAVLCYSLQIYFDFSGYSDMAIGLGRMFGFRFLENFRYPYISKSITEFWRRWHISLSSWFRDYLYIPFGGNRGSTFQTYRNLFIVFFLCGLWHGASWSFVIWGLYHGGLLVIERSGFRRWLEYWPVSFRHIYVILAMMIGWVFFRAESIPQAFHFLAAMCGQTTNLASTRPLAHYLNIEVALLVIIGIVGSTPFMPWLWHKFLGAQRLYQPSHRKRFAVSEAFVRVAGLSVLLGYSLLLIASNSYNPFIYFRF